MRGSWIRHVQHFIAFSELVIKISRMHIATSHWASAVTSAAPFARPGIHPANDLMIPFSPTLCFLALCSALASASISSSEICPPKAYHTTLIIPSVAVNTHPAIAAIPRWCHPSRWGKGPTVSPERSVVELWPAALPLEGRFWEVHWVGT